MKTSTSIIFALIFTSCHGQIQRSPSIDDEYGDPESGGKDFAPHPWTPDEFPNPILSPPAFCRIQGPSNVCDPEGLLDLRQKMDLNTIIKQLKSSLKCYCKNCSVDTKGLAVGVAITKAVFRPYKLEPKNNMASFADYLREKWNLGMCGNDILILVATRDELWYPSLGEVAKRVLPTDYLDRLYQETQTYFTNRRYFEGLSNFVQKVYTELDRIEKYVPTTEKSTLDNTQSPRRAKWPLILGIILIVLVLAAIVVLVFVAIARSRKRRREEVTSEEATFRKNEAVDEMTGNGDNRGSSRFSWNPLKNSFSFRRKERPTPKTEVKAEYIAVPSSERKESGTEDFQDLENDGLAKGTTNVYSDTTEKVENA